MTRPSDPVEVLCSTCLALPGASQRVSHGAPAFFAGRQFAHLWVDGHHGDRAAQAWLAAPPGAQEALTAADPLRWFVPPYVGHRGWVGVRLDGADPLELEEAAEAAWRCVASRRLVAEHAQRLRGTRPYGRAAAGSEGRP